MKDGFGREIDYLRISLTDKCNLRCSYCMPKEGIKQLGHDDILTYEEIWRLVSLMADMGIRKIRLTGGEPLVRKNITGFIRKLKEIPGICEVAVTTNGTLLPSLAYDLKEAGLDRMNISLDTLRSTAFKEMTGKDLLSEVKRGIKAVRETGIPMKLNVVPVKGVNDTEAVRIAEFAQSEGIDLRFIELMPIGCASSLKGVSVSELIRIFEDRFGEAKELGDNGKDIAPGPSVYYSFKNYKGRIGFISPLSRPFCASCNRIRLTAEGFLKLCLQYSDGADLKTPLRDGRSDEEISELIEEAVAKKPSGHSFNREDFGDGSDRQADNLEYRRMVQIGG
ncbi:MAG: GTP 3',8-cyclase MoaA [Lachnospiraceae bacterium]|nr:GTP 3',8-cyclase MoaA [Lachnospiraceae bacterium]